MCARPVACKYWSYAASADERKIHGVRYPLVPRPLNEH
ncbi:Uncharacterised protein [Vibrio cholerae]|nr:Uncharacterised protein [Vibrio cholerae]CSI14852.1 Uncharacterised protein [Vibrio cholerae]